MAGLCRTLLLLCSLVLVGCGDDPASDIGAGAPVTVTVTSPALGEGQAIPPRFTCDGPEQSPPLAWRGEGEHPAAWGLVVDDPDAPGGTFVHWVVVDIPARFGAVREGEVPAGAAQATNSSGEVSYAGPCPPSGTHRYRFTVYALSAPTGLADGADLEDALAAIESAAEARGTLVATYGRGSS